MELSQLTPAALQELIQLVEKKQTLRDQIEKIDAAMLALAAGKTPAPTPRPAAPSAAPKPAATPKSAAPASSAKPVRAKRGALKEGILAALETAGPEGLTVTDLSAKLGVEPANIHVWFSTTGKKLSDISKVSAGRYALAAAGTAAVATLATLATLAAPAAIATVEPAPLEESPSEEAPVAAAEVPAIAEPLAEADEIAPALEEEFTPVAIAEDVPPAVEETFEESTVTPIEEDAPTPKDDEFQLLSAD